MTQFFQASSIPRRSQRELKGADIISAAALTIPLGGDHFDVTGTVTVTSIVVAPGRIFTLRFDDALTLTDSATLDLAGANILTVAGDRATFQAIDTDDIRILSYQREGVAPLVYATQAEQETAAAVNVAVTPGRQQYHPGHVKAWTFFSQGATHDEIVCWNITSITDGSGAGDTDIDIATDFSTASYAILGTAGHGVASATLGMAVSPFVADPTASTLTVVAENSADGTNTDAEFVSIALLGDQA